MTKRWYIVSLLCLLAIISYVDRLSLSLLVEPIRADLGVSDTQVGLLLGPSFAFFYAGMALPLAWAIDRFNRKLILVGAVALWSLATCSGAFAESFAQLAMARIGVGIGEAALTPAVVSLIGDLFERARRPTPIAAVAASQALGATVSFLLIGALLAVAGKLVIPVLGQLGGTAPWRTTLFLTGLPGLILALILLFTVREPARCLEVGNPDEVPTKAFAEVRGAVRFFLTFLLGSNLLVVPLFLSAMWFPTHLIRGFGMSPSSTGFIYGMLTLLGVVGALGLPSFAERWALRGRADISLSLMLALLPLVISLFLLACLTSSLPVAIVAMGLFQLFGNGIGAFPPVVIAGLADASTRGRFAAMHLVFQAAIPSALAPFLVGLLTDTVLIDRLGVALAVVAGTACPIAWLLLLRCFAAFRSASRRT